MVKQIRSNGVTTITLRPNRSASWQQTKLFLAIVTLNVFVIALAWSFMGAWLILPFAGLEVGLLGFILYRVSYASYQKQVIRIDDQHVSVSKGVYKPIYLWRSERRHTHLKLHQPTQPHLPMRMQLSDGEHYLCLGNFLNEQDAKQARLAIKEAGIAELNNKWWLSE